MLNSPLTALSSLALPRQFCCCGKTTNTFVWLAQLKQVYKTQLICTVLIPTGSIWITSHCSSNTMATHLRSVRLKVLLDAFYTDHRQKAFVILQKSWKTIHDLQEHIQKIFRIPISVFLTVDGCLLPCDEGIHVVSETDAVK